MPSRCSQLFDAVYNGDVQAAEEWLEKGARVNIVAYDETDGRSVTPLTVSIDIENMEMIRMLLRHGANVNLKPNHDYPPLHFAVGLGNVELVETLLQHGADVNIRSSDSTPLHTAIYSGNLDCLQSLLRNGADVQAHDRLGDSPLFTAVLKRKWNLVDEILLENDVNDFKGLRNIPLLIQTLREGEPIHHRECLEGLLTRGANPNVEWRESHGRTALIIAILVFNDGPEPIISRLKTLIGHGACVNKTDDAGYTPLMWAISCKAPVVSHYLISEAEADVLHRRNNDGHTAFSFAVEQGQVETTYLILRRHLDHFIPGMMHYIGSNLESDKDRKRKQKKHKKDKKRKRKHKKQKHC